MPHTQMMEERLRFLKIDSDICSDLQQAKQIIDPALDELLEKFYEHILGDPDLKALFVDQDSTDRARAAQRQHWSDTLFSGRFDTKYFEKADRIGRTHFRVGLTPNAYIGAYCYMLIQLIELISTKTQGTETAAMPLIRAVCKAVFLDLDLVIHCFLEVKDSAMREILRRATGFSADISALNDDLQTNTEQIKSAADEILKQAYTCAAQTTRARDNLGSAVRQLKAAQATADDASVEHILLEQVEATCNQADKLSQQVDTTTKGIEQLVSDIARLQDQTRGLRERLDQLQFGDKLYIDESVSDSSPIKRLLAMLRGKR